MKATQIAKPDVQLNCVVIKDRTVNRVAMYIAEIPEVIADGENEDDAMQNLITTLKHAFEDRRKSNPDNNCSDQNEISTRPVNLVFS